MRNYRALSCGIELLYPFIPLQIFNLQEWHCCKPDMLPTCVHVFMVPVYLTCFYILQMNAASWTYFVVEFPLRVQVL